MSEIRPKTQYSIGAITAIHGNGSAFDVNVNGRPHDMTKLRGSFDTRGIKVGDRVIVAWAEDNSFLPFILDVAGTKKRASVGTITSFTPTEPTPVNVGQWPKLRNELNYFTQIDFALLPEAAEPIEVTLGAIPKVMFGELHYDQEYTNRTVALCFHSSGHCYTLDETISEVLTCEQGENDAAEEAYNIGYVHGEQDAVSGHAKFSSYDDTNPYQDEWDAGELEPGEYEYCYFHNYHANYDYGYEAGWADGGGI